MSEREEIEELLDDEGYLDEGWEVTELGDLVCPHGHGIEQDGRCPDGCESPLLDLGLI